MIPGKYIGIDLFTNVDIFKKYKERLYNSHLIELIEKIRNGLFGYYLSFFFYLL